MFDGSDEEYSSFIGCKLSTKDELLDTQIYSVCRSVSKDE